MGTLKPFRHARQNSLFENKHFATTSGPVLDTYQLDQRLNT